MNKVTLKARGQQFEYQCAPNVTPLRAARDQFIPIPTGCIRGGCGMCKVKVVSGEYDQEIVRSHDALSDEIITIEDYEKLQKNESSLEKVVK